MEIKYSRPGSEKGLAGQQWGAKEGVVHLFSGVGGKMEVREWQNGVFDLPGPGFLCFIGGNSLE